MGAVRPHDQEEHLNLETSGRRDAVRLAGLGFELAASVAGFCLVGHAIDKMQGTYPWGVVGGSILGMIGGLYNLIRQGLSQVKEAERGRAEASGSEGEANASRRDPGR